MSKRSGAEAGTSLIDRWEALGRPLARLPRWAAITLLVLLVGAMAWSSAATAPIDRSERERATKVVKGSGDIALYARISERVAAGENYYDAALDEQRRRNYPTRPFVTVRQPTLAWLHSLIGVEGVRYLEMALLVACLVALADSIARRATIPERLGALVILALGGAMVASSTVGLFHEVWAGLWLTLALLLYRPERWWPALLAAACALAVRDISVPFVLLWLVFALVGRRWREAAGVALLLAIFSAAMGLHFLAVEAGRLPSDPVSPGWNAMAGFGLPLMALSRLTGLLLLPVQVAAPIAILPLLGWVAIGGRLGLFAGLWFAGLFTMIAMFARPENFYWAQLGLPAYGIGFAFVPRALAELLRRATGAVAR